MNALAALVLVLAAGALGAWVLRAVRALPAHPGDGLLAAIALGNGLLGVCGLVLAGMQALDPVVAWAVVLGLAAPGIGPLWRLAEGLWRRRRTPARLERVGWVVGGAHAAALVVMVLAPSVTGDQTKYQLAYPKLYAEAGGLIDTPWTFWGQQQFLENFVFALAFTVGDETTAHLVHAAIGGVAIAAVARLVGRWLAPGWQGAMALVVATQPMTWSMFGANGSDLPVVAATLLAVAALLAWTHGEKGALRRAALLAGVAGGTKVMGLLTPALVGVGVLLHVRREGLARMLRVGLAFGGIAGAVAAAPYLRNAVEVGNPLHPFAHGVFEGRHWSGEAAAYLDEYYRQYQVDRARRRGGAPYRGIEVARFPWDLTIHPESFERSARWALDVGPFMLAAMPAALWMASQTAAARTVVVVGAVYVGVIAAGLWAHPRYVLPGVWLLAAAGMGGVARLLSRRLAIALVCVTVAGHLVVTARLAARTFPDELRLAAGAMTPATYLERRSDRYRFWRAVDHVVPADGLVLVLGKIPHPYFIGRPFVLGSYLEQAKIDYRRLADAAALMAITRELGATHVVFVTGDLDRAADPFEARVTSLWRDLRADLGTPLVREGERELFAMPTEPRA